MGSPIILQDQSGLAQGINQAGGALAQALQFRQQQAQKQSQQSQQQNALQEALGSLNEDSGPLEYVGFLQKAINSGVPPEQIKLFQDAFLPGLQEQAKEKRGMNFLQSLGLGGQPTQEVDISTMSIEEPVQEGAPVPAGQKVPNSPLQNLSDTQLVAMAGSGIPQAKAIADAEMKRREVDRKEFRQDREFAYKRAGKHLEKIDASRKTVQDQDEALNLMEGAIRDGNAEFFSEDNFAGFLGKYGEGLRTAKGVQLLNAQKEFLVSDIGRVGNRPNQWIEQQISGALTKIGRSKAANLTVIEALRSRIERDKKRIELTDDLEETYTKELGYVPGNIAGLVSKAMEPYEKQIAGRLAYKTRQIYEKENSGDLKNLMNKKVSPGTPLTVEMAKLMKDKYGSVEKAKSNAKKLGYTIPTLEEYQGYIK